MKNPLKNFSFTKVITIKVLLVVGAMVLFALAAQTFIDTQQNKARASHQAQQAVFNHTETLDEIKNAVDQLKANNQKNHDTTVAYIKCIIDTSVMANQNQQPITEQTYNSCLVDAGVQLDQP